MKNTFFEYNLPGQKNIQHLWEKGLFIFDSNILLNLYRYSKETSEEFLETILTLSHLERIALPYQVGLEFHRNRLGIIKQEIKHYQEFIKKFNSLIEDIENNRKNPFFSPTLNDDLIDLKNRIEKEAESKIREYEQFIFDDPIFKKIQTAFEGKVYEPFSPVELKKIYEEGDKRYKEKTPPGYLDEKKEDEKKYGDLILWKQIMAIAGQTGKDILFILDDRKEDWWLECLGKTVSPRPELLKEFAETTHKKCHFYKPFQFLEFSNKHLNRQIKQEIIDEVKNYKPEVKEENIYIKIIVFTVVEENIQLFIEHVKSAGYHITHQYQGNNIHSVFLKLPNIPDLERRFREKYLENLDKYHISIIHYSLEKLSI